MPRESFDDLLGFLAVARAGSFTRAAAQLGVSQSALSHSVRALESRLGVRLLTRTTRSVAPTQTGERLLRTLGPRFDEIAAELAAVRDLRDKPAGTIRITTAGHAAETILWPKLARLLPDYPEIKVEISVDYGLIDIVARRFDAGVRLGEQVEKDMIAVRIGPDLRMAVVGTPGYFARRPPPQTPQDLAAHKCINLRLPTYGELLTWEFERDGQALNARVEGQWVFSSSPPMLKAALAGFGLAYLPEDMVLEHLAAGRLERVLEAWCAPFTGYHLYYPSPPPVVTGPGPGGRGAAPSRIGGVRVTGRCCRSRTANSRPDERRSSPRGSVGCRTDTPEKPSRGLPIRLSRLPSARIDHEWES